MEFYPGQGFPPPSSGSLLQAQRPWKEFRLPHALTCPVQSWAGSFAVQIQGRTRLDGHAEEPRACRASPRGGTELQVSPSPGAGVRHPADVTFPAFVALERLCSAPQLSWRHLCSRVPFPLAPRAEEEEEVFQLCSFPLGSKGRAAGKGHFPSWLAGKGSLMSPWHLLSLPGHACEHPARPTSCMSPAPPRLSQTKVKIPVLFLFSLPLTFPCGSVFIRNPCLALLEAPVFVNMGMVERRQPGSKSREMCGLLPLPAGSPRKGGFQWDRESGWG